MVERARRKGWMRNDGRLQPETASLRCATVDVRARREERVDTILHVAQHVQQYEMPRLVVMIEHDPGGEGVRVVDLHGEGAQGFFSVHGKLRL